MIKTSKKLDLAYCLTVSLPAHHLWRSPPCYSFFVIVFCHFLLESSLLDRAWLPFPISWRISDHRYCFAATVKWASLLPILWIVFSAAVGICSLAEFSFLFLGLALGLLHLSNQTEIVFGCYERFSNEFVRTWWRESGGVSLCHMRSLRGPALKHCSSKAFQSPHIWLSQDLFVVVNLYIQVRTTEAHWVYPFIHQSEDWQEVQVFHTTAAEYR